MAMAARGVVDLEHLGRYTGGDQALNAEVLRLFDMQASEMVARLESILAARDSKSWKDVTHTLKGAARGIGAFSLADAAAEAEPMDLASPAANEAVTCMKSRAIAVQDFIKAYLAA